MDDGRSARKRRAIIEAATAVFLSNGYRGTSMDEIAARAAVSKQTVYKQFADKERLFTEIILATIDQVGEPFHAEVITLGDTDDLEGELDALARRRIAQRSLLRLEDPLVAAHQFNWLITSVPLNQVMLCGSAVRFSPADLDGFADAGVRVFLEAYG